MTSYDDVDGMKPQDFIKLWNNLIRNEEKEQDSFYQQKILDMFRQIDFDQDGRVSWDEFSSNLVQSTRKLSSQFPTYDESPQIIKNPTLAPHELLYIKSLKKLMTCGPPEQSGLWSAHNGTLYKHLGDHKSIVNDAIHIPELEKILTCSSDRSIIIYEANTLKKLKSMATKTTQLCMIYDSNSDRLYSGGTDYQIHVWDLDTYQESKTMFFYAPTSASSATTASSKKAYDEKTLKPYKKKLKSSSFRDSEKGHTDFIMDMIMLEELNVLITCSLDKTIKLWDTRTGYCKHTKRGHLKGVTGLTYSQEYRVLVSWGCEKMAYLWNPLSENCVFKFEGHSRPLIGAHIVEGTPELITVDTTGIVIIWDIRTLKIVQKLRPNNTDYVRFKTFCYDYSNLQIIVSGEQEINYWKSIESETLGRITNPITQLRYNRVFKQLLTSVKRFISVWKGKNGELHKHYPVAESNITDFVILGQWRNAAVCTVDGELKKVSLMDGDIKNTMELKDEVRGLFCIEKEVNDEEKPHLLIPMLKGCVKIVDIKREVEIEKRMSCIKNCTISGSSYSEKHKLLVTVSGDTLEIWYIFHPTKKLQNNLVQVGEDIVRCIFCDLWNCFVSLDTGGNVRFYSVPSFRLLCTIPLNMTNPITAHAVGLNAFEEQDALVVSTSIHVYIFKIDWLTTQARAELNLKSILSSGKTAEYRHRLIINEHTFHLNANVKHQEYPTYDRKRKRMVCSQFLSADAFQNQYELWQDLKELNCDLDHLIDHEDFIAFDPLQPDTRQQEACIITEMSQISLSQIMQHQDLKFDDILKMVKAIARGIFTIHSAGYVINNLCCENVVRVNGVWKITNLHHAAREGEEIDWNLFLEHPELISPEYASYVVKKRESGTMLVSPKRSKKKKSMLTPSFHSQTLSSRPSSSSSSITSTSTTTTKKESNSLYKAMKSHDLWSFSVMLLQILTKFNLFEKSVTLDQAIALLVESKEPLYKISHVEIIDVTLRNLLRNILKRNHQRRWTIEQVMSQSIRSFNDLEEHLNKLGNEQGSDSESDEDDSDSDEEEDHEIQFPSVWDKQSYSPFVIPWNDPHILVKDILVTTEGAITCTEVVSEPPLIITTYFKPEYQDGYVLLFNVEGQRIGNIPRFQKANGDEKQKVKPKKSLSERTEEDRGNIKWSWPDVADAKTVLDLDFDIPEDDEEDFTTDLLMNDNEKSNSTHSSRRTTESSVQALSRRSSKHTPNLRPKLKVT
eukprot:CAMPEP_0117419590 /NCGR_PEP_ID=MMETSP0758-20121206/1113_1 /TAXON_ID=63605 /ORGANISM="Percolomonas cosmopolitus, Strain AE-1 (ATCC 50343)" /LENGTH=1237 /DNA_ID=CAMNT_0005200729 /DNA_START=140 /DNA_END=3849 /DNA_ORIENTATION=+